MGRPSIVVRSHRQVESSKTQILVLELPGPSVNCCSPYHGQDRDPDYHESESEDRQAKVIVGHPGYRK
jgi:hypothetical protein